MVKGYIWNLKFYSRCRRNFGGARRKTQTRVCNIYDGPQTHNLSNLYSKPVKLGSHLVFHSSNFYYINLLLFIIEVIFL